MEVNESYYPSDSEDELTENDKILISESRGYKSRHGSDSEEEVYGLLSSSGDESENEQENEIPGDISSDIDVDKGDELPDSRAWGQKRRNFYDTDLDPDFAGIQGKDSEVAELEELEARNIQERLAQQLDAGTEFYLDALSTQLEPLASEEKLEPTAAPIIGEKIQADLSKLTKRQKLDLIKKESPEFFALVNDFKEKMTEIINIWHPMKNLVTEKKVKSPLIEHLVQTKHNLILNYCTHIGLYLLLKSRKLPVQSHPIIKRLFQLRQLINSLSEVGELIIDQIDPIMKMVNKNQEIKLQDPSDEENSAFAKKSNRKKRLLNFIHQDSESKKSKTGSDEEIMDKSVEEKKNVKSILKISKDPLQMKGKMQTKKQGSGRDSSDDQDGETDKVCEEEAKDEEEGKRAITYQMAKNKGLTPRRKKEQRNPRVKHRNKFRKAKIRRKGQVREVRMETNRYGGEISGIKASISKSIKIK